jgi:hypothetical protein
LWKEQKYYEMEQVESDGHIIMGVKQFNQVVYTCPLATNSSWQQLRRKTDRRTGW